MVPSLSLSYFFKKWYQKFLEIPPNVPQEHHQWVVLAYHIDFFAIALVTLFLVIPVILNYWIIVSVDMVLIITIFLSLFIKRQGKMIYKQLVILIFIITAMSTVIKTLLLGWHCGFEYYLLLLVQLSFYIPFFNKKTLYVVIAALILALIVLYCIQLMVPPFYEIPRFWKHLLFLISLMGFSISLIYVPIVNNKANRIAFAMLSKTLAKNAELERLSKLKDDFLANTSHELRTPLHGISGIAESLCNDPKVKESDFLCTNLSHILTSSRRLTNLVNDILDFSKMRHNDLTLHLQPVDIIQIIKSVLPNFTATAAKKGIQLKADIPGSLPFIMADEDRLIQILFNLIGNAIKFTDTGNVTVSVHQYGKTLEILIIDTGIGIDEKDCITIFEAFEQESSHQGGYRGGTGLGLSITKKLVELHGGTISVSSKVGCGSTFSITLPAYESNEISKKNQPSSHLHYAFIVDVDDVKVEQPAISPSSFLPQAVTVSQKNRTIVTVDDEPVNLQIVKNHLEPLGYSVITAENGNEITELITKHNPSLILLDIMMPGMNGYECCRAIREKYSIAEMPVIFISAKNRISDLVLGFEAGANDYVLKPFLREELIARVEGQIHQQNAVEAIKEVAKLKEELANRILEEAQLKQMQERLTRLLHSVDDGLIVAYENGEILFANNIIIRMLGLPEDALIAGKDLSSLIHQEARQHNLMTAKLSSQKFTPVIFLSGDGSGTELLVKRIPLETDDELLTVFTIQSKSTKFSDLSSKTSEWIFAELEKNRARISELELLSTECLSANKRMMEQLTANDLSDTNPFTLANRIMLDTIALWKETTGKEKWDFAEASGLWKVHPDEDGWQRTATLDRYLDFRKMPKFPRWITVIESARFILREAKKRDFASDKIKSVEQNVKELEGVLKGKVAA